jgi:RNA polymerase sigma-70 factor (ECF subfamily)
MTDLELINRIIEGDRIGFNQLIRKWEQKIYNFVFRYLGNKELALDVTQKTFFRTFRNIKKLKDSTRFSPWIYQIAANLCKDELKKMKRQNIVSLDLIHVNNEKNGYHLPEQFMESAGRQPDVQLNKKQIAIIVQNALRELPEEQRIVIIMKEYQGLKFKEIAAVLNEPLSTIKSRMYNGLKALKEVFEQWHITEEVLNHEM